MIASGRKARVLVVEDDAGLRYVLRRTLANAGYDVLEAGSGAEALRVFDEQGADLVLLDVALPDMDGTQVRRELKARAGRAPLVIHLSGVVTSLDGQARALEAGADGYLTKPVPDRTLLAHVNAVLRLREAESALVAQQRDELRALLGGGCAEDAGGAEVMRTLGRAYGQLLDWAVEQRGFSVQHPVAEGVRELAAQVAGEGLGAREVVELHARALEARTVGTVPLRARVVVEEARLLLVHVLGELVNRYRASERRPAEEER